MLIGEKREVVYSTKQAEIDREIEEKLNMIEAEDGFDDYTDEYYDDPFADEHWLLNFE